MANENIPSFVTGGGGSQAPMMGQGANMPTLSFNPLAGKAEAAKTKANAKSFLAKEAKEDQSKADNLAALRYRAAKTRWDNDTLLIMSQDTEKANMAFLEERRREARDNLPQPENDDQKRLFESVDLQMDPPTDAKVKAEEIKVETDRNLAEYDQQMSERLVTLIDSVKLDPTNTEEYVKNAIENSEAWLDLLFNENNPAAKEAADAMRDELITTAIVQENVTPEQKNNLLRLASSKEAAQELRKKFKEEIDRDFSLDFKKSAFNAFIGSTGDTGAYLKPTPEMENLREEFLAGEFNPEAAGMSKEQGERMAYYFQADNWAALSKGRLSAQRYVENGKKTVSGGNVLHLTSADIETRIASLKSNLQVVDGKEVQLDHAGEIAFLEDFQKKIKDPLTRYATIASISPKMSKYLRDAENSARNGHYEDSTLYRNAASLEYAKFQKAYSQGAAEPLEVDIFSPQELDMIAESLQRSFSVELNPETGEPQFTDANRQGLLEFLSYIGQTTPEMRHMAKEHLKRHPDIDLDHGDIELISDTIGGSPEVAEHLWLSIAHKNSGRPVKGDKHLEEAFVNALKKDPEISSYAYDTVFGDNDDQILEAWASFYSKELQKGMADFEDVHSSAKLTPDQMGSIVNKVRSKMKKELHKNFYFAKDTSGRNHALPKYNDLIFKEGDQFVLSEENYGNMSQENIDDAFLKVSSAATILTQTAMPDLKTLLDPSFTSSRTKGGIYFHEEWRDKVIEMGGTEEAYSRWKAAFIKNTTMVRTANNEWILGHMGRAFDGTGAFVSLATSDGSPFKEGAPVIRTTLNELSILRKSRIFEERLMDPAHAEAMLIPESEDKVFELRRQKEQLEQEGHVGLPFMPDTFQFSDWSNPWFDKFEIPFVDIYKDSDMLDDEIESAINNQINSVWEDPSVVPFHPAGEGFDYEGAEASGLKRDTSLLDTVLHRQTGHFGSLGEDGLVLKGISHKTFIKTYETEKKRGSDIVLRNGRLYSTLDEGKKPGDKLLEEKDGKFFIEGESAEKFLKPLFEFRIEK